MTAIIKPMQATITVSLLVQNKREAERLTKIKNRVIASNPFTWPVTNGLFLVLSTFPSKSLSKKSLITHPAERIKKVPIQKMITSPRVGEPSFKIMKALRVGQRRRKVPMGFSSRMSFPNPISLSVIPAFLF